MGAAGAAASLVSDAVYCNKQSDFSLLSTKVAVDIHRETSDHNKDYGQAGQTSGTSS